VGGLVLAGAVAACVTRTPAVVPPVAPAGVTMLDQGPNWTAADRAAFYTRDQGARIIRLAWLKALPAPDGQGSLADGLTRYGYLPNPPSALPVGFTTSGSGAETALGMTCAACHTRQIDVGGVAYRVDGGPGIVDFQSFLADLDHAVGGVLASDVAFGPFAAAVLGHAPGVGEAAALRGQVVAWYRPYHAIMSGALPATPWGPARLDAVGMILDRVTGLDIGTGADRVIAANIRVADAPVRYPFLWNSAIQDQSQWPGFAAGGDDLLALSRNVGEVYGVFAQFAPTRSRLHLIGYDYIGGNSTDWNGLAELNGLVKKLGAPKYPFPVDAALAARGAQIFGQAPGQGQCAGCHWPQPGAVRVLGAATWKTPVLDVGTDTREYDVLNWQTADTGVLTGAHILNLVPPLKKSDSSVSVLKVAVIGSILQHYFPLPLLDPDLPHAMTVAKAYPPEAAQLKDDYDAAPKPEAKYEARVLQGIWAAAPYLHDGAVPTLADLLKPVSERPAAFAVGPEYDTAAVGLARSQTAFGSYVLHTTDCGDRESGASRCGHLYGTELSSGDKAALVEYLKTL
jgi:hypothetical protein